MSAFSSRWNAMAAVLALANAVAAAPALTTIQDVLYKADGTRFNGSVTIAWNNFQTADNAAIPVQAVTINVINGNFRARLAPTTNASAGANYTVQYSSQGKFQFTEVWAVPPTSNTLRVRDVRIGAGTVVGPPPPVVSEVMIADVTGLSDELNVRPLRGIGYGPARTAVINAAGQLDAAAGNAADCVHVDGTAGPCGTGGGTGAAISFADGETPSGLVNGVNTVFNLNYSPSPAASLALFRNGILMKRGFDYTLSGATITFFTVATPQAGDLLTANYRYVTAQ